MGPEKQSFSWALLATARETSFTTSFIKRFSIRYTMGGKELKKVCVNINGMHCASCEVLVERKFKSIPGIEKVNVNHASGKAELYCSCDPDLIELNAAIKEHGYTVTAFDDDNSKKNSKNYEFKKEHLETGAIFLILVGIYFVLKQFNILPDIGVSDTMSYGLVFIVGLVAALSTCLAVTGGLLLSLAAKYNQENSHLAGIQKFKPHIYFNIGRIISYTVLGGLVGVIGSTLTLSNTMNGYLTLIASIVMILLGLQMLNIFNIPIRIPKSIAHKVFDASNNKRAPFLFGAATFFFPCGFTQALQLYVLSTGSFVVGAMTMFFFSLGTLPSLLSIGALSSFTKGNAYRYFVKTAAVLVIVFGIISIKGGLTLAGVALPSLDETQTAQLVGEEQVVDMKVTGLDYYPNQFTIKQGIPVRWQIDGRQAQGCAKIISAPQISVTQRLSNSEVTTITFTPQKKGRIQFTCGMGMAGPGVFEIV